MLVIGLGLGAALLLALGFVVQQHAAASAPDTERLSLRLLIDLAHRPLWLGGIASMVGGQILGALALDNGGLTLVEPLLACNILFALPMAAAWSRKRLGWREWVGVVVLIAGLAAFVIAAGPSGEQTTRVSQVSWLVAGLTIVAVVAVVVVVAKRSDLATEATLLAVGAGILYGLQDGLTQRTLLVFNQGFTAVLTTWQPYCLLAVAITGLVLAQSAFEAAPPPCPPSPSPSRSPESPSGPACSPKTCGQGRCTSPSSWSASPSWSSGSSWWPARPSSPVPPSKSRLGRADRPGDQDRPALLPRHLQGRGLVRSSWPTSPRWSGSSTIRRPALAMTRTCGHPRCSTRYIGLDKICWVARRTGEANVRPARSPSPP